MPPQCAGNPSPDSSSGLFCVLPFQTTVGTIRRLQIAALWQWINRRMIDNARYYLPSDLAPAAGEDLRPLYRPRTHRPIARQGVGEAVIAWIRHKQKDRPKAVSLQILIGPVIKLREVQCSDDD